MNYNKLICFQKDELDRIFRAAYMPELLSKIQKIESFPDNSEKDRLNIYSGVSNKIAEDRDEHEIFAAGYIFLDFYKKNSQVCFELKNSFDTKKEIKNLADLKNATEKGTLNDFVIKSKDGFRLFQLKRYRDELSTSKMLEFIKSKLARYGNNLGTTNLLIMLQPPKRHYKRVVLEIDWKELNKEINNLDLKSGSQILISYNENNEFLVINQGHPNLTRSKIPAILPSGISASELR